MMIADFCIEERTSFYGIPEFTDVHVNGVINELNVRVNRLNILSAEMGKQASRD